jgi:hypothetical protein
LSANPLRDLQLFLLHSHQTIKQVDLSWSYLLDTEIEPLFTQLAAINQDKIIILVSRHQPQFEKIISTIKNYPKMVLLERMDNENEYEIPAFTPTEAKTIGRYQELPHRKVTCRK